MALREHRVNTSPDANPLMFETVRMIPADHPCLAGHFPGAPIVPAVVILEEVEAALAEWRGGSRIAAVPAAKFLVPIKPGQPFTVRLSRREPDETDVNFSCSVDGQIAVQGRLQIDDGSI
jgi:3-hydroxyacyl-[acyl-carrier-protein] dehydratase